jgi:hypothetical protein
MSNNGRIQVANLFRHLNPNQRLAEGVSGGFSRIGMKGKVWTLLHQGNTHRFIQADGQPLSYLDVVFVGINPHTSKLYYEGSYRDDTANPPDCASLKGDVPDPHVPKPQSKTCALCRNNVWKPNRGGKDCQDHKRAAVLLLPYMKMTPALDAPLEEPVFLKIPPASLRSLKSYSDSLQHRGAHFASVITRITFAPDKLFQMDFSYKQPLTDKEAPLVLPLLEDPQTQFLIGSLPEIQELPSLPPEQPQETGLTALLGREGDSQNDIVPLKRGPGRPKKVAAESVSPPPQEEAPAAEAAEGGGDTPWDESDSDLDADVSRLMSQKVSDMMK